MVQKYDIKKCYNTSEGYVTLIVVLFISVIGLSITLASLNIGIDSTRAALTMLNSERALHSARACTEEALMQINASVPYIGTSSLSFADSSCSYTVSSLGGQNRLIESLGQAGDSNSRIEVVISKITPNITISSWDQVSDF